MTSPATPLPPAWIYKRDGRLVPFEADRISQALFAVTESLGQPDAFLARELTDGVVHFLASEVEGTPPTTAQVRELVVKIVRELGQPALAEAFANYVPAPREKRPAALEEVPLHAGGLQQISVAGSPAEFVQGCLREYTLRRVFSRDLAAAQSDGLLTLMGLENPLELASCVVKPATGGLLEALIEARNLVGNLVALDGPEHTLAAGDPAIAGFVRELVLGLRATGLSAVVNLNCASPPSWADDLAEGPLFANRPSPVPQELAVRADVLRDALQSADLPCERMRIDWHLAERDFHNEARTRLVRIARLALDGDLALVFDRPRRPILLAEGVDRLHPAVLLTVGLHLPQLAEQAGLANDSAKFLQKLGSLARLALSAATQKREFLRRHSELRPDVTRGFLLPRARLVAAPVGLESVVRRFTGRGLCGGKPATDFARQVVQRLREVLRQDGRACLMETCLDGATFQFRLPPQGLDPASETIAGQLLRTDQAVGLTAWDDQAEVTHQLKGAGPLHAAAEMGTAVVFLPSEPAPKPEQIADWLRWAWQQTEVGRLRFLRSAPAHHQPLLKMAGGVS